MGAHYTQERIVHGKMLCMSIYLWDDLPKVGLSDLILYFECGIAQRPL